MIIDCNYSGKWVQACRDHYSFDRISVQASCKGDEETPCMESLGSLFLINWT
jgi:hypothetical protein